MDMNDHRQSIQQDLMANARRLSKLENDLKNLKEEDADQRNDLKKQIQIAKEEAKTLENNFTEFYMYQLHEAIKPE